MKCLAINTATSELSIAITEGDSVLYLYKNEERRDQGNTLISHIKAGLAETDMDFADLDLLAVVTGPGSFTGIRIGIAAMRGIAMAAKKPLVGISSFEMYSDIRTDALNIVAIESWRMELYLSVLDENGSDVIKPINEVPEVLHSAMSDNGLLDNDIVISGDACRKLEGLFPTAKMADVHYTAVDVARKAVAQFKAGDGEPKRPTPYYMRAADVTISSKLQKKIAE